MKNLHQSSIFQASKQLNNLELKIFISQAHTCAIEISGRAMFRQISQDTSYTWWIFVFVHFRSHRYIKNIRSSCIKGTLHRSACRHSKRSYNTHNKHKHTQKHKHDTADKHSSIWDKWTGKRQWQRWVEGERWVGGTKSALWGCDSWCMGFQGEIRCQ